MQRLAQRSTSQHEAWTWQDIAAGRDLEGAVTRDLRAATARDLREAMSKTDPEQFAHLGRKPLNDVDRLLLLRYLVEGEAMTATELVAAIAAAQHLAISAVDTAVEKERREEPQSSG
jgi:hypothetical protein